jgi:hypothetical protein
MPIGLCNNTGAGGAVVCQIDDRIGYHSKWYNPMTTSMRIFVPLGNWSARRGLEIDRKYELRFGPGT